VIEERSVSKSSRDDAKRRGGLFYLITNYIEKCNFVTNYIFILG